MVDRSMPLLLAWNSFVLGLAVASPKPFGPFEWIFASALCTWIGVVLIGVFVSKEPADA